MTKSRPFLSIFPAAALLLGVAVLAATALIIAGCGSGGDTSTVASPGTESGARGATTPAATAKAVFLAGSASGGQGREVLLNVEVARTSQEKATGLMFRRELAPDRGMVFVWDSPVTGPFYMKNTPLPLAIAFISGDGVVVDLQEMVPQSLDLHYSAKPYTRAVEANQGFFTGNGVRIGDQVRFEGL